MFRSSIYRLSLITFSLYFFFNATATTETYTLSLHDALPISLRALTPYFRPATNTRIRELGPRGNPENRARGFLRSEEHTSELQSHLNLVCRLLLEKKKKKKKRIISREQELIYKTMTSDRYRR